MTEYIPSLDKILVAVLSFVAGFMYRKRTEAEEIADAFDEGFEKGAQATAEAISRETGMTIDLLLDGDED